MISLIDSYFQKNLSSNNSLTEPLLESLSTNQWELVDKRIDGSFLSVYRARPKKRNISASYAFKTLQKKWQGTELGEKVLRNEIELGSTVFNPHILPVLDFHRSRIQYWKSDVRENDKLDENSENNKCSKMSESNDLISDEKCDVEQNSFDNIAYWPGYFITPWLEGETLQQQLAQKKQYRPDVVWKFGRQIVKALDALNQQGWSHNDLKPSNLFVSSNGHITLIDFGFSTRKSESLNEIRYFVSNCSVFLGEKRETFTGTPFYTAPELLFESSLPDIRSDFYSLGIVLFEMLTGKPHFNVYSGKDLFCKYEKMRRCGIENDLNQLRHFSPQAVQLLQQLTARKREERPQSTQEILTIISELENQSLSYRECPRELRRCA